MDLFQIPERSIPLHGPASSKGTCPHAVKLNRSGQVFPLMLTSSNLPQASGPAAKPQCQNFLKAHSKGGSSAPPRPHFASSASSTPCAASGDHNLEVRSANEFFGLQMSHCALCPLMLDGLHVHTVTLGAVPGPRPFGGLRQAQRSGCRKNGAPPLPVTDRPQRQDDTQRSQGTCATIVSIYYTVFAAHSLFVHVLGKQVHTVPSQATPLHPFDHFHYFTNHQPN